MAYDEPSPAEMRAKYVDCLRLLSEQSEELAKLRDPDGAATLRENLSAEVLGFSRKAVLKALADVLLHEAGATEVEAFARRVAVACGFPVEEADEFHELLAYVAKLRAVEAAARADHDACIGEHLDEELEATSVALRNALKAIAPVKEPEAVRGDPVPHASHELVENADENGDLFCVSCGLDRDDDAIGVTCQRAPTKEST